jgi:hypothetical protein
MNATIHIPVNFFTYPLFPAKANCDKCDFSGHGLCVSGIKGVRERCGYGQNGYWLFSGDLQGRLRNDPPL